MTVDLNESKSARAALKLRSQPLILMTVDLFQPYQNTVDRNLPWGDDLTPHLIYLLTARVVGAPQVISQPASSIFFLSILHCPLGLGELQTSPFPGVVLPPLLLFALSSSPLNCALQDGLGKTW